MTAREFAVALSISRHLLYALAALPMDHPQRSIGRHQVQRMHDLLLQAGDHDRQIKIKNLLDWYDNGAIISSDIVVLSEQYNTRINCAYNECDR